MNAGSGYRHLFTPLRLGPVTVPNRIVFSAHLTNYATSGLPTEQHAAYYAARAAGGAGLIITEEHSTHPTDWPYEKLIHGFNPEVVPGYRRITEAVHAHDVPILAQINHNGGQASSMYSRLPGVGSEPGARSALPRGAQGRGARRDRRDRGRIRARGRPLHRRGVRRHRAPVLAFLHRPRFPLPGHQSPERRVRRGRSQPGPAPARTGRRGAGGDRPRAGRSVCGSAATSSSKAAPTSTTPWRWPVWWMPPARSTTSTPRSGWPPPPST